MIKRWLIALIRIYQRFLSPLKRMPSCRFVPTCSSYALEAIAQHGAMLGTAKALWRLLRCNPLFPGGYDPVDRRMLALHQRCIDHGPETESVKS